MEQEEKEQLKQEIVEEVGKVIKEGLQGKASKEELQELQSQIQNLTSGQGSEKSSESEVSQQQIHDQAYAEGFKAGRINLAQEFDQNISEDNDLKGQIADTFNRMLEARGLEIREAEPAAETGGQEGTQEGVESGEKATETGTEAGTDEDEEAPFKVVISAEPLSNADESFYSEEQGGYVNFIDKRKGG